MALSLPSSKALGPTYQCRAVEKDFNITGKKTKYKSAYKKGLEASKYKVHEDELRAQEKLKVTQTMSLLPEEMYYLMDEAEIKAREAMIQYQKEIDDMKDASKKTMASRLTS